MKTISYAECSARTRISEILDGESFHEWLPPECQLRSPHLAQLGVPSAFDDGVVIGTGHLDGQHIFIAAQEGEFMGGGVGEIHGAKLVGLLRRAQKDRPTAVLLLVDSGGVRLHEANAGLIAVSEVMRAVLEVRSAGIPVIFVIGGANGCFGGMGIVARCADVVIMSDIGRLAMSGPEVIEASAGVEEFDSKDRSLVWRTTGGKHRWITGDCDALVEDEPRAFREAVIANIQNTKPVSLSTLEDEHELLLSRMNAIKAPFEGEMEIELWRHFGLLEPERVPDMAVNQLLDAARS